MHDALFFDGADALLSVAAPFLLGGLADGEAAVIATAPVRAELLLDAVGDHPLVHVIERRDVYRERTPAAITTFQRLAERYVAAGVRRVRVVGEVDFGTTEREWLEWQRYEAVINEALAAWPLWGLCVFDTGRLPAPVIDSARRAHPSLSTANGRSANPDFLDPAALLRSLPVPEEPMEATPPRLDVGAVTDFTDLRHRLAAELAGLRAPVDTVEDFLLAADEMASNALRHGVPPVRVRLWSGPDRVVCRIEDAGAGCDNPFAGYGPAHGNDLSRGGMGLWLARQLCDHVDITGGPDGSSVRLTLRLR